VARDAVIALATLSEPIQQYETGCSPKAEDANDDFGSYKTPLTFASLYVLMPRSRIIWLQFEPNADLS
jgi:hypothetical protein